MPTKPKNPAPSSPTFMDPALMPWALVFELYWISYKLLERRLYHLGVSASQARVLAVLHYSGEPMKPSAVATLLFQETQSITGILHRIESRGWVVRTPDPNDRRAVSLELTASGRKLTDEIVGIMRELYDELFAAALGAVERRQVEARAAEGAGSGSRRRTSSCGARSSTRSGRTDARGSSPQLASCVGPTAAVSAGCARVERCVRRRFDRSRRKYRIG